jgi:hypothetical protein
MAGLIVWSDHPVAFSAKNTRNVKALAGVGGTGVSRSRPVDQPLQDPPARDDAPVTASKTVEPDRALLAEAVTIARPARELYEFWRDQTNLVRVMENIVAIEKVDDRRWRWTVKAPAGREVSWEAATPRTCRASPSPGSR